MKQHIADHLGGRRGGDVRSEGAETRRGKELARVIDARVAGDRLPWPQILRRAFVRVRHVVPDARRPNRRFPERLGEVPGRVRRVPPPRLLVAIDTSGSMTVDVLGRIVDEIESLRRWARVDVVEADAVVHRRYRLRTRPLRVTGGGDTDFGPAIDEADRRRDIDGLVYFTDGRGTMPTSSATPVLWVVTHDEPFEPSMGVVVRLPSTHRAVGDPPLRPANG